MFAKEPVNTGRQPEIDLAKAVFIIQLAMIHCFVDSTIPSGLEEGVPYYFDSVIGGPFGAPMTLFSMGIGLMYSRHCDGKSVLKRGFGIWLIGWLHNTCRFLIPSLIGYAVTHDYERYVARTIYNFFGNDLLQFAGLAMMLMGLLMLLKLNIWQIAGVGGILFIVAELTNHVDFHNVPLNIFMGHFIGVEDSAHKVMADFPLCFWFFLYALGRIAGYYLLRLKDKDKFYKIVTPIFAVIVIPILILEYNFKTSMMGGEGANVFYHPTFYDLILCIMATILTFGVDWFIMKLVPAGAKRVIETISRDITPVYFFQWVLVFWVCDLLVVIKNGTPYMDVLPTFVIGVILSLLSLILGNMWMEFYRGRKTEKTR